MCVFVCATPESEILQIVLHFINISREHAVKKWEREREIVYVKKKERTEREKIFLKANYVNRRSKGESYIVQDTGRIKGLSSLHQWQWITTFVNQCALYCFFIDIFKTKDTVSCIYIYAFEILYWNFFIFL